MANPEHVEIVKQGAEAIRKWREENPDIQLDLNRADLREAHLTGADLSGARFWAANLWGADLSGVNLSGASLAGANLSSVDCDSHRIARTVGVSLVGADLSEAELDHADCRGAHFDGANLKNAVLDFAELSKASFRDTSFENAEIYHTIFGDVDLSTATSLDTVKHKGPSIIGIDTLYRSKGKIPEAFLHGCGVPDALIAHLPSLLGAEQAIQFYSCFISYSHKDEEFARRLHSRMRDEHLRVWFAPDDMKSGRKLHEQIEQAIRVYDKLLLVLSETSMKSEWVATEIYHARQREVKENRQVLFPIRLVPFEAIKEWKCFDADTGKDMAREIREYFVPDFSNWKDHDSFETAFKRLLDNLRADGKT